MAAVAAVPYFYRRVDEEIRCQVETRLAQHYSGLQVKVGSAEFIDGEGIKVRNLVITDPAADGPRPELLHVEELLLACRADRRELLHGEPQITQVTVRHPTIRMTRRPDGSWSAAKLLPTPKSGGQPVETYIEGGVIEICDPLRDPAATFTLRDINVTLAPLDAAAGEPLTPDTRKVHGSLAGDHLRRVEVDGLLDSQRDTWTISGQVEGLDLSGDLYDTVPEPLAAKIAGLRGLRGQAAASFRVAHDPSAAAPWQYEVAWRIARGRIDDPRLPHPVTDMTAAGRLDNQGLSVEELAAQSNQAKLKLSYRQAGFSPSAPKTIEAEIRHLELDRRLLACLPESLQEQWHKYRPGGFIDADAKFVYDGRRWTPDLAVRCLNVSFTYYKFPYRLEEGSGRVTLKDDVLQVNLMACSGTQSVRLDGRWERATAPVPVGSFEAHAEELQLDTKLISALPDQSRAVVQSLRPEGTVKVYLRSWRDAPEQPVHQHLVLNAKGCAIQYEKFPYPLRNIRGTLEMYDGSWTFRDLEGYNNTGRVRGEGHLAPTLQGNELFLRLTGNDVALDEQLRDALRHNERQVWQVLRPRGAADLVAEIRYLCEPKQLSVSVDARTNPENTSIEPVHFPYRLEKLDSLLHYRDGRVTIARLKAEHGPVRLATGGYCEFPPGGRWHLRLEGLAADRVRLDRDLMQALPEQLKKSLAALKPSGAINIRGSFDLEPGEYLADPARSAWNVRLGLSQASLDCGVKLENIHGTVHLAGSSDGKRFQSRGELTLDSLHYKDYQFTQVMGPLWIDQRQVLLGSWVARRLNEAPGGGVEHAQEQPRPVTARIFGGILEGDAWVTLGDEPRYGLRGSLAGADLARCAAEIAPGQQRLRGKIAAAVEVTGSGRSTNALSGRGTIRLRDADVYELPVMISLLKLLSVRAPDQNAFSSSDIEFRIGGEHLYFDRIDFSGDAISLRGKGEMDFQQAIRMTFYTVVGRGDLNLPVLKEVFKGASQQILQIHVDGTLRNPEVKKDPFPGVNQALQQLGGDPPQPESPLGALPQRGVR